MATEVELNSLKCNSFSVKDLLDLPRETKMMTALPALRQNVSVDSSSVLTSGFPSMDSNYDAQENRGHQDDLCSPWLLNRSFGHYNRKYQRL